MEDSTPILARRTKGMTEDCAVSEPTDAEMNAARKALARWQTPEEFEAKVKSFSSLVKSSTLFNKANACFLLDAIPIAEFARYRALQFVRLAEQHERVNDGQFRDSSGQTVNIEVTEVMEPERRRGDEYRCGSSNLTHSEFEPNLGKAVAGSLASRVEAKAKKAETTYTTRPLLLVYINFVSGGRLGNEVETEIEKLKAQYADTFHEICVLWSGKFY